MTSGNLHPEVTAGGNLDDIAFELYVVVTAHRLVVIHTTPRLSKGTMRCGKKEKGPFPGPFAILLGAASYILRTFASCSPFGPCTTSNSTCSPSDRLRKPSATMAVWCTNTSGAPSRVMKPKPFASLNHFTVPFSIVKTLCHSGRPAAGVGSTKEPIGWPPRSALYQDPIPRCQELA